MFRLIARRTWRFFDTFVTAGTHYLPPDNFQEIPAPVIAPRTSPTNIGLALLSTVSAHDFGWLGLTEMAERLENTLATLDKLQKHQGHLFNWYDIHDLRPLDPLYVSTVDSGNLAGHLWTVANACRELSSKPLLSPQLIVGFEDVLALLRQIVTRFDEAHRAGTVTALELREMLAALEQRIQHSQPPASSKEWIAFLTDVREQSGTLADVARTLAQGDPDDVKREISHWSESLLAQTLSQLKDAALLDDVNTVPSALKSKLHAAAEASMRLANAMEFGFLLDPAKKIFSIGYQVGERKLDASYYDLLASESRLASYLAIAKGDVPTQHWFRLGRPLKPMDQGLVLLSWSGSMFEYLMPALIMESPQRSLLDQTNKRMVQRQISYGAERDVPWGISESAYNAQNLEYTYQYSNFGVPGLGLKRGLGEDLVIAPYATALATMVDAPAAAENFQKLSAMDALGAFGYYESLDFTPTRLPENQTVAVVRTYMAHHQGMSLVALTNVLHGDVMRARFHAEPRVQAAELLLQEKTPRNVPVTHNRAEEIEGEVRHLPPPVLRRFHSAHQTVPPTHLLSNGYYSVMITAAGGGYSRAGQMAVTRWHEDATRDNWGSFIFLRDVGSGEVWSAGYQPAGAEPDRYEVDFSEDRAEIIRHDGSIITTLEVVVSPEDNAEIRRVSLKNGGGTLRDIDVTSYAEVVLASPAADQAHPAFSNLFVQTEFAPEANGLLCTRRKRTPEDAPIWMAHVVVAEGDIGALHYETDRARLLGRGRGVRTPMSIVDGKPLTNTVGAVIDPIMSLRKRVRIEPGATARVTFTTAIASSRDDVVRLADKYHDSAMFERTVTLAWTQAHVQQNYLGIEPSEAHLFQNLASRLIYANNGLRPASDILKRNTRGAPGLWAFGISGDIPIVLVRIDEMDDLNIVREILRAHEYWRMKNLAVDLVIVNERTISYVQDLQVALENLIRTTQAGLRQQENDARGKIFLLRLDQMSSDDHLLIRTAARITLLSRQGTLAQQVERLDDVDEGRPMPGFKRTAPPASRQIIPAVKKALEFLNGLGGFSDDGKEYVTVLGPGQWTPAPWANVISNPSFGFHVSESGSGSTWSVNSRENQLTPWSNDPVSDAPGEVFYLRDEDTGHVWTPTLLPMREEDSSYTVRHGQGYSQFEHTSRNIQSQLLQFVPGR